MMTLTMRGQKLDMSQLVSENQHKVALGNAGLNARGDKIAPGGTVLQTREQIMTEYNTTNPKAVRQMGLSGIRQEELMTPQEAIKAVTEQKQQMIAAAEAAKADKPVRRKITDSEV